MPLPQVTTPWYASAFTGMLSRSGPVPRRPHDPEVSAWAGTIPRWGPDGSDLAIGGAGWEPPAAEAAGVGEAIERCQSRPMPQDATIRASYMRWPLDEPAVEPGRWILFHADQYSLRDFPFRPWSPPTIGRWTCCRELRSGDPWWVPEALVYLTPREAAECMLGPAISTGLSCGRAGDPIVLRGLQEVIERDALVGAWWGAYELEEHDPDSVFAVIQPDRPRRLLRPNLRYRFYRVRTPFSSHVTVVSIEGEDHEGWCFSVGSACREMRCASWEKSILEAVQGRHYVRYLKASEEGQGGLPANFAAHAVYYSYHPEKLVHTPLHHAARAGPGAEVSAVETLQCLAERLGPSLPVLFRNLTPPALAAGRLDWQVVRVIVPGLQPLHGHHGFPFLGGPLWGRRPVFEWESIPPHPFP
jgi:ribosomal protein S12 methylthiotransferase accessory factor